MSGMLGMMLAESTPHAFGANVSQSGIAITPANASASLRWTAAGECEGAPTSGTFASKHTWRTDLVRPASDYEIQLTNTVGTFSTSAAGSGVFINLGSTRTWTRTRTSDVVGSDTVSGTFSIRHASSGLVVASGTFSMTATVDI
jgi:hypothetical protein